ncbi:hypothetical protein CTA1_11475 [Colletotrichum tanaceti]|uniref:Uncharacterized protein n=1 Tax=Colletotrichum tanaceti TaxID=1306861 RepID=A0A4U6XU22_9PEZI|nr:hypothetical protein CTA1_11475 [Colletotrichum tanaceti]
MAAESLNLIDKLLDAGLEEDNSDPYKLMDALKKYIPKVRSQRTPLACWSTSSIRVLLRITRHSMTRSKRAQYVCSRTTSLVGEDSDPITVLSSVPEEPSSLKHPELN